MTGDFSGTKLTDAGGSERADWVAPKHRRFQKHYTNGIAENINNHLKTIIKLSYGYHNFERFRKRAMMIVTYRKDLEN